MSTDNPIRFRLVGAVILIVLAVIFLPWLLDGAGYDYMTGIEDPVPDPPSFAEPDIALPSEREAGARGDQRPRPDTPREGMAQLHSLDDEGDAAASGAQAPVPLRERSASEPLEAGWTVQVGSFRDQGNARELEQRLREAELPAFVDTSTTDDRRIYRVKVGPLAQRDQAQALGERLQNDFGLEAIVVAFP
ncbi:MAG: SPOR domain-containing protein [Pseudomonadota bacterium]